MMTLLQTTEDICPGTVALEGKWWPMGSPIGGAQPFAPIKGALQHRQNATPNIHLLNIHSIDGLKSATSQAIVSSVERCRQMALEVQIDPYALQVRPEVRHGRSRLPARL